MKTTIVKIGNSQGIRIPKPLLAQTKLGKNVELSLKDGTIVISAAKEEIVYSEAFLASREALSKEWDTKEEDAAWEHLQ